MHKQHKGLGRWTAVLTLALALAMTLTLVAPGFAEAHGRGSIKNVSKFIEKARKNLQEQSDLRFEDCEEAMWALEAIAKMRGLGIITGYDGNLFLPNSAVKQAEALAMIVRALGMEDEAQALAKEFGGTYATFNDDGDNHDGDFENNDDGDDFNFDFGSLEDGDDVQKMLEELGKRLEARSKKVNGRYLPYVPSNTQWALGYILLAVDQGWVKISEVDPNAPASRAWVSMVMVRALGEEEAAQDKMDTVLPYKDMRSIPESMVGYVAVAVELGLFEGYPDGKFQPNKPVTRAEMATIIDRHLKEELPEETPYSVTGEITEVSSSKVTVETASGRSITYTISPDALILIDDEPASASELAAGDEVEVLSNGEGVALLITLKEEAPETTTVTGEIVYKYASAVKVETDDGETMKIALASGCEITYGSKTLKFSDLRVGDTVKVTIQNGAATAIKVTLRGDVGEVIKGVIDRIGMTSSGTEIVLNSVYGEFTLELDEDVEITYGSASLDPDDLRIGDEVEATVKDDKVTEIVILDRKEESEFGDVGGVIVSISQSASEYVVTVQDDDDDITSFAVAPDCIVTYGSSEVSRSALRLGDEIRAELDSDDVAVEIRIYSRD